MTAESDRIEVFHNSTLPADLTANFSSSNYCHNRQYDNQYVLMCQSYWEQEKGYLKRCAERCNVTRSSLDTSTILVLFSFICIFVIIGLSVWVIKLTKRLKEFEQAKKSRLHKVNNSHDSSNSQSFVYEISNQSTSNQTPTERYTTLKVLETNDVSCPSTTSQNTPMNSNCGHTVPHIVLIPSSTQHNIQEKPSFKPELVNQI